MPVRAPLRAMRKDQVECFPNKPERYKNKTVMPPEQPEMTVLTTALATAAASPSLLMDA